MALSKTPVVKLPKGVTVMPDNSQWTNRFEIKSSSSNRIYTIAQNKSKRFWGCSCPGWIHHRHCKHIKALGLPCFEIPAEITLK